MKKYAFFLGAATFGATTLLIAGPNQGQRPSSKVVQQPQPQSQPQQQAQPPQPVAPATDCSKLSPPEQNFANQLTQEVNRAMFCGQFTPQQRQQAMSMTGQTDVNGNMVNADQAVQQVMQTSPAPNAPRIQQKRPGGACPVK